jgi:hypothetical protein
MLRQRISDNAQSMMAIIAAVRANNLIYISRRSEAQGFASLLYSLTHPIQDWMYGFRLVHRGLNGFSRLTRSRLEKFLAGQ